MFKQLIIGTLATGIMLSGFTSVSAAEVKKDESLEASNTCSNVKHKFSKLFDSKSDIPKTMEEYVDGEWVTGKLVCYYNTGVIGWVAYYN